MEKTKTRKIQPGSNTTGMPMIPLHMHLSSWISSCISWFSFAPGKDALNKSCFFNIILPTWSLSVLIRWLYIHMIPNMVIPEMIQGSRLQTPDSVVVLSFRWGSLRTSWCFWCTSRSTSRASAGGPPMWWVILSGATRPFLEVPEFPEMSSRKGCTQQHTHTAQKHTDFCWKIFEGNS